MIINANYVVLEKVEKEIKDGYSPVELQDDSLFKGRVVERPFTTIYVENHVLEKGDIVLFAPYSPDTHDIMADGKKIKFVNVRDLLAVVKE